MLQQLHHSNGCSQKKRKPRAKPLVKQYCFSDHRGVVEDPNRPPALPAPFVIRRFSARGDEISRKPCLKMRWRGKTTMF